MARYAGKALANNDTTTSTAVTTANVSGSPGRTCYSSDCIRRVNSHAAISRAIAANVPIRNPVRRGVANDAATTSFLEGGPACEQLHDPLGLRVRQRRDQHRLGDAEDG